MHGFIVILLYLAAIAAALHSARRERQRGAVREPAAYLAAAAVVVHASWLADTVSAPGTLAFGLTDSASLLGLMIGLGGAIGVMFRNYRGIAAMALGGAALLSAGTGSLAQVREVSAPGWPLAVHMVLAMGAAGMFAIAALVVLVLAWQDAQLRSRRPAAWLASLPAVESLENALFAIISTGFAALTVAILAGLLFVSDLFAQHLVHKTTLALAAWLVFAVLLTGRFRFGWRGRKAAHYTLAGFALLVTAYFGSKFVLEVLLGRHWG